MEREREQEVRRREHTDPSSPTPAPGRRSLTDSYAESATPAAATPTAASPAATEPAAAEPSAAGPTAAEPTAASSVDATPASTHADENADESGDEALPRLQLGSSRLVEFARKFNREFAAQLHVFATEQEPESELGTERVAATARSSRVDVSPRRLGQLFTPTQIDKLTHFIDTRLIPDRLFNGDDIGRTTAQQRIVLSGHILAVGEYVPGSFAQQVHARMCGHWASLVYHYAGAAQGNGFAGRGIFENFDHAGNLSLSVSEDEDGGVRATTRTSIARQATVDDHVEGIPFEEYASIQPGDWLWIYNESGARGGNHSVIFSRWISREMEVGLDGQPPQPGAPVVRYRRAVTMSQISPSAGGFEETRLLGERRVAIAGDSTRRIAPITRRMSVDPSARPIQRMEDLVALLGHGREARQNEAFLRRRFPGNSFDAPRFVTYLRGRNRELIEQLSTRMTPVQLEAFRTTNESYEGDGELGLLGTLVRLHQRLVNLVASASALDGEGARARGAAVEEQHAQTEARVQPQREELTTQHEEHVENIDEYESEHASAGEQIMLHEHASPELAAIRARRRQLRPELNRRLRRARSDEEREQLREQLAALDAEFSEALAADEERRATLRQVRREHRRLERRIAREQNLDEQVLRRLRDLRGASGYHVVAEGIRGDTFQGRDQQRVTGLLEDLRPAPDWPSFRIAQPEATRTGDGEP